MRIAECFTNWLIKNGADNSNRAIYIYGIECFINEFIADIFLLLFGILSNQVSETLLWLVCFTIIRVHLGGFHASTHFRCILASTCIGALCLSVHLFLSGATLLNIFLSIVSLIIIAKIAPVIHPNHPVPSKRIPGIRQKAIIISSIEVLLILIFLPRMPALSSIITLALLSAATLGIIGYQKQDHVERKGR